MMFDLSKIFARSDTLRKSNVETTFKFWIM